MNRERKRLSTFKNCVKCKATFSHLSQKGFYYDVKEDVIICCECNIKKFNFHQKLISELDHKPNCTYFEAGPQTRQIEELPAFHRQFEVKFHESGDIPAADNNEYFSKESKTPPQRNRYGSKPQRNCTPPSHQQTPSNVETNLNASNTYDNGVEDLSREEDRLKTFKDPKTPWPLKSVIDENDLAKVGFFYLGLADRVQCYFCNGILRKWSLGDKPFYEHKKHFPNCPHIVELSKTYNN